MLNMFGDLLTRFLYSFGWYEMTLESKTTPAISADTIEYFYSRSWVRF